MKRTQRSMVFVKSVGANIREARRSLGVIQKVLARRLSLDGPALSRIESGKKDLRLSALFEIAGALKVQPSDLVRDRVHGQDE